MTDDFEDILINGMTFQPGVATPRHEEEKVKTKARKKKYVTGAHGSASAKQKVKYREHRAKKSKRK